MRYVIIAMAFGVLVLLIAGCGEEPAKPDSSGTVTIELSESLFTPSNIEVTAGTTVRFVLNNVGAEEHEFMIGRTVSSAPGYPDTFETDFFHGVNVEVIGDPGGMVMAGEAMLKRNGSMAMDDDHSEGSEGMAMDDDDSGGSEGMAMDDDHSEDSEGMAMDDDESDGSEGMAMDDDHSEDSEGMADDHGFMVSQLAGVDGVVVVVEIPDDKEGVWEIGCFVDEGTHYEDGMTGTLTVVEAP